jgi:type VI secretion system protein ImpH
MMHSEWRGETSLETDLFQPRSHYGWRGGVSVVTELFAEPYRFEFFQAVRLLELRSRARRTPGARAAAPAVGALAATSDVVRFRASYDLSFPPSEIRELALAAPNAIPRMTVAFFGAGGLDGPLPTSFTEAIVERLSRKDTATADFLDIFHHRLLSLLYRIYKKHRPALATAPPAENPLSRYLFSLVGLGTKSVANQAPARPTLLRYAGLLAAKPRSAAGLATLASDYFKVPVQVQQFAGEWVARGAEPTTRIGRTGQNNGLGGAAVVGTRVWLQDAGIRLRIGPLSAERFASFLPNGEAHWTLAELVRLYLGPNLRATLQLVLDKRDAGKVGYTRLGLAVLGSTSWLRTAPSLGAEPPVEVPLRRQSWRRKQAAS